MASGDTKTQQLLYILENGGSTEGISGCCNTKTQDYIIQNIEAVKAAESAITAKGGTVGDTGLAGLENGIASIPSGGGTTPSAYGRLWFYPWSEGWTIEDGTGSNCTVQFDDEYGGEEQFKVAIAQYKPVNEQIAFTYDPNTQMWFCYDTENPIEDMTTEKFSNFGLSVTIDDDTQQAEFYMTFSMDVDTNSNLLSLDLTSEGFQSLANMESDFAGNNYYLLPPMDYRVYADAIRKFEFGDQSVAVPNTFLYRCYSLREVDTTYANISSIGTWFLGTCERLTGDITIPSSVTTIGNNFMYGCSAYTGTLICNTSATPTDGSSLATYSSTSPMYTTGVTLSGPYAQTWATALPNSNSNPYRKLIVAS